MEFNEDVEGSVPKFGAIFMSNSATKKECLKRKIFGLPLAMANFVKQVKSGMILFLFEYEKRELYGVFQATSDGIMNLKPQAFTSSGNFPAQVRIAPIWSCRPLSEVVFREAIKDNYYSPKKFRFGLSEQQVRALLHLFYLRRLNDRIPDIHRTRKRKINDDGMLPSHDASESDNWPPWHAASADCGGDASESEVLNKWPFWHVTSADCSGDTLGTINSAPDSAFFSDSRFSTEHVNNSLIGSVGADRESLMNKDRFKSVHNIGDGIEPDFLSSRFSTEHIGKSGGDREPLMIEDRFRSVHNFGEGIEPYIVKSRFSTEHIGKSSIGLVGADREPLMIEDRFKSAHNFGDGIEPGFLNSRFSTEHIGKSGADREPLMFEDRFRSIRNFGDGIEPNFVKSRFSTEHIGKSSIGLIGADREPLMMEDRAKSVLNIGDRIERDHLPVYPSYITLSEDVVADDYTFSKDDGVANACDVESCIKPNFSSGLVSIDTLHRTVPYDPEFPDINYQCPSQIMNSAQNLYSHQVHDEHFLPLSTSKCVPHDAALGSLYSEAPVVKASVFSRLSVAPRTYKKEDKGIHDEDGRLASIDEIMDSLHHAHNRWVKGKPPVGPKSRYVYVRCKEDSEFSNQSQSEPPLVAKEMTTDVDCFLEEDSDIVWKETRVVDFKRRSKKNKVLDDMASKVSAETTRTCKISVNAEGEDLAGKAGKTRKLIRPDFSKKLSHDSTQNSPSALNEATDILGKCEGGEKIDERNSQDHKEVTEVGSGSNECEQKSSLQLGSENRVNVSKQDLVSCPASGSGAQEQPPYTSGATDVPKNLEEKETAGINHQVSNGDTLEQRCSLQS
ncbi:hypothetical protein ACET3Z_004098 [Daucus carota]